MAIFDVILGFINSALGASAIIAVVVEFALRLFPSPVPLSILHLVAIAANKIGLIFAGIGSLLDRVLPQRLAPPKI